MAVKAKLAKENPFVKKAKKKDGPAEELLVTPAMKARMEQKGYPVAKPNPFVAKAQQKKLNPFVEKAKKRGRTPEEMAELREIKAHKAMEAEKERIKALPGELRAADERVKEARKRYEQASQEVAKLFKKVDSYDVDRTGKIRSNSEREKRKANGSYHEDVAAWEEAEDRVVRHMNTLQSVVRGRDGIAEQLVMARGS